jgi:predicted kinase
MASKLIVMKGLPASGKSTWAKAYVKSHPNTVRINRDDLRLMLFDVQFDARLEDGVNSAQVFLMAGFGAEGLDIVLDNTNLNPKVMRAMEAWAKARDYELEVKDFTHVSLSECIQRDSKRGAQSVGKKVITRMWRQFLQKPAEKPAYIPGAPYAIICDLDGTLAHMGDRSPYDASTCDQDAVDETIANIVRLHRSCAGDQIIFCSGRDEKYRAITEEWIRGSSCFDLFDTRPSFLLLMRPEGDTREDSIIKTELYHEYIEGKYNVRFCLDDRDRVVDAWRDLGLVCLQCAPGDF